MSMKRFLTLLAFVPAFLFAQTTTTPQFTIKGKVTGLTDGAVRIATTQDNPATIASGTAKNGVFTLTGSIPEPGLYYLILGSEQPQYIFLENKPITITGSKTDIKNLQVEGSSAHKDFVQFNKTFNPLIGELNALGAMIQRETSEDKRNALLHDYDSVVKKVNAEVGDFVAARKSSFVSPFLLWVTAKLDENILTLEQRFQSLDENVRNSGIGKSLSEYITFTKVGAVGTDALEFTQNDVNGNPVTLSSFRGKYVLVDFWASWCRPCRAENPNVVRVYNRFKDKNFTIIGVSLDEKKENWTKAIEADNLTWNHVSDLQQWNNAVAQLYHVQSIPGNFLIDPNGKIIARDLRGADLEKKLCELFGGCN